MPPPVQSVDRGGQPFDALARLFHRHVRGRPPARHRLGLVHDRTGLAADDDQGRPMGELECLGQSDRRPYTKAHLARSGRLPLSSTVARYFVARTDGSGHGLTSGCEYLVTGSPINARWWSIALYDDTGSLIENASNRYSFNSEEALRHSDGTFRIRVARTRATRRIGFRAATTPTAICADAAHLCAARHRLARRRPHPRRPPAQDRARHYATKDPRTLYGARNRSRRADPYRCRAHAADARAARTRRRG